MNQLTANDVQNMVSHWLDTPINGYLGSSYGAPRNELLQRARGSGVADWFLQKLRDDVPLIGALPASAVNLYKLDRGADGVEIFITVSGTSITVGTL